MLSLNTHQLNVFLAAAETLNYTQAAQRLQVTQPSVSQNIQSLEEHFGLALFTRSGRNIQLTEAGRFLVPLAREMVYLAKHIEESMASLQGDVQGHLVVGCSTTTGRYLLPKLLATFHGKCPQVVVTCRVGSREDVIQWLCEGKVHLAIVYNPDYCQDVEFCRLTKEDTVLVAPLEHPWVNRGVVNVSDLRDGEFVLPCESLDLYCTLRDELRQAGVSIFELKSRLMLGSIEAIALAVQEGMGLSFVPRLIANRLVTGRVAVLNVRGLTISRDIFVGRSLRRPATAAQDVFWELLTQTSFEPLLFSRS
jgi:DNA-binding transcriptional LysR family regulator